MALSDTMEGQGEQEGAVSGKQDDRLGDDELDEAPFDDESLNHESGDDAESVDEAESVDDLDDDADLDGGVVADDYDEMDDGDDEDEGDGEDGDEDDEYEDASPEDVDFVLAFYREDGNPVLVELPLECANDLDELIAQLRRMPGDSGAAGVVSIAGEFFVLCRVRGRAVQVFLNDSISANDWPIARDVLDFLGMEVPDPDDESETVGDLGILADQGVSDLDLETIAGNLDEDSDELVRQIMEKLKFGPQFERVLSEE